MRLRIPRAAVAIVGMTAMLAACGTPGTESGGVEPDDRSTIGTGGNGPQGALTPEEVRAAGDITLRMTDFETEGGGLGSALDELITQFETEYPNVTVERTSKDFNSYGQTIQFTLSEDDPPDIAELNVVMARSVLPAGLILSLDDYYEGHGWDERYPTSVLGLLRATGDGKTFGDGEYWGQSLGGNLVGVYYNATLLEELGLDLPQTFAEFEAALEVAAAEGVTPVQLGNLDQWPANHVLSSLMNITEEPDVVREWIHGQPGSTFETPGIIEAAGVLQTWSELGYLPADANGISNDDSIAAFADGDGLFYITGSWRVPALGDALGDNGGFFLLPPRDTGDGARATGWLANPFAISSRSEHPDVAAFFLDYMSGPEGAPTAVAGGYLPLTEMADDPDASRVATEVVDAWRTALRDDGLVPYLDFATPSMGDVMFPAIESLIAERLTPEQLAEQVQADWASYHTES